MEHLSKSVLSAAVAFCLGSLSLHASPGQARKQYESGRYHESLLEYEQLLSRNTNDSRLFFNAGDAAYRAEEFERARRHFNNALLSPDLTVQEGAYYNLGNTLFQLGQALPAPDKKQQRWEEALGNYQNALRLNPQDADAQGNLNFVKKQLEELKKQQAQKKKNEPPPPEGNPNENKDSGQKDQKGPNQKEEKKEQKPKESEEKKNEPQKGQGQKPDEKQNGSGEQDRADQEKAEAEQMAAAAAKGQMTRQQAEQFLEAQRQEEKALIFTPEKKPQPSNRPFKDW